MTKQDAISELVAIQEHRRKTWQRQWGETDIFVNFAENAKYQKVEQILSMFRVMTDAEYAELQKRASLANSARVVEQTSLF